MTQPKINIAKLINYFMYNLLEPALLYIKIKLSLKSRD